jgi:hypothetical protein
MSLGKGAIQTVNARSFTGAELVSIDDVISKILWIK